MHCVYLQCRDTFWVESFNHQYILTYILHFGSRNEYEPGYYGLGMLYYLLYTMEYVFVGRGSNV